jgi:translocation and assembly module TamB
MTWKERLIGIPLALVGAALLLATGAGMMFTRTDWGREQVRAYALQKLNDAIQGRVEIGAVLEGDLLRAVRMADVRIYEPDGREFALVDTVAVHYRWSDFLLGNITFPKVTLVGPVVNLETAPGEGWNFDKVFAGQGSSDQRSGEEVAPEGGGRRIVLREVAIRSGDVTMRFPWTPGPDSDPDSSAWHLEEDDGRWQRVVHVERLNATLPYARVAAPREQNRLFQVSQLSGRATVIREPFEIEQLRADIEVHGDTLIFDIWEADLPESRVFGEGWVTLSGALEYDLALRGDPVRTEELWWLVPQLPSGLANLDFGYRSLPDGMALEALNARWSSPDAELSGGFAITMRDRPDGFEFHDVDLDIERLSSTLVGSLTGWQPPLEADLMGAVRLDGPLSELRVDGDIRIRPEGSAAASHLSALGTLHIISGGLGARELEVQFDSVQLDLVRAFVPGLALRGELAGFASADGRVAEGIAVTFDVEGSDPGRVPTRLSGSGTLTAEPGLPLHLDLSAIGEPFSLNTLAAYYPAIPFRGDFTGLFRAVGPLDDLDVGAELGGQGDSLRVIGNVQLVADGPRYRGEVQGSRIGLPEFRSGLPQSDLDFRVEFEGRGSSLAELTAQARVDVFASFVAGVRFDSASALLRIADGRLLVDTSVVRAEFGELDASGALSLQRDETDSLRFELQADSLGGLNPWLFPVYERLVGPSLVSGGTGASSDGRQRAGIEGTARAAGWIVRDAGHFAVRGRAQAQSFSYGDLAADSLRIEGLDLGDHAGQFVLGGQVYAADAGYGPLRFAAVELSGALVDTAVDVAFDMAKPGAGVKGRIWAVLGQEARTVGLDALNLELGASTWGLVEPASFRIERSGAVAIQGFELRSSGRRAMIGGSVGRSGPVSFSAHISGVDLAEVALLWSDSLELAGTLELHAELAGDVESPVAQGDLEISEGDLFGVIFSKLRGGIGYEGGDMSVDASMWQDQRQLVRLHGTLPFELGLPSFRVDLPERPIQMTFEGDSIPLALVSLLTDQIEQISGHAQAAVLIRGTPDDVDLQGPVTFSDGAFRVVWSGISYEGLEGRAQFDGKQAELRDVSLRGPQGGTGSLSGTIDFVEPGNPEFDLQLTAVELSGYDQLDARVVGSGTATLKGPYDQPVISGDLSIISGVLYIEEIGRQAEIVNPFEGGLVLIDTIFAGDGGGGRTGSPFVDNMIIDLRLNVEHDTWLRSEDMNVEIAGDLTLYMQRSQDILRINGTLEAVRGEYRLFNKRFAVVGGTIEFVGEPAMNPNLRINALYTVRTQKRPIDIRLVVGGTLDDMTLTLESDAQPPIPESDLLSYLLFGRPSYELTRTGEESNLLQDVTAGVPHAFVGYALGSLLVGETGIAYVDVTRAPVTPAAEGEYRSGVGPALSVAQHLVGAVRPTVRLEWRLDDRFTLRGVTEPRFGREGTLFYGGPGTTLEQSIGVFLLYGWAY